MGHKCLVVIDDIQMTAKEHYGTQTPLEILRQWLERDTFYLQPDLERVNIVDTVSWILGYQQQIWLPYWE